MALRSNAKRHVWVVDNLLKTVVIDAKWKANHASIGLSKHMTRSDEACGLWVLENNFARWMDMHNQNNMKTSEVPAKHTCTGGSEKNGRARKHRGMSDEGVTRFNDLVKKVGNDRDVHDDWEMQFLTAMRERAEAKKSKKRRLTEAADTAVVPLNDFGWDGGSAGDSDDDDSVQEEAV